MKNDVDIQSVVKYGDYMINNTKIVSVVCPGHSGSTLLDMTLGTLPNVASCGELLYIPWKIFKENRPEKYVTTYCGCGEKMSVCPYWLPVLKSVANKVHIDIYKHPEKFNISINHSFFYGKSLRHNVLRKAMEKSSRFIHIQKIIDLLYPFYSQSIENNWKLFDAMAEIHGEKVIVDSSKDIYRYLFLKKYRKHSSKLIILIRDVYGVASSIHNIPQLTDALVSARAKAWLRYYNDRVYHVLKHLDKSEYIVIRYEDLANDFERTRKKLALFLDISEDLSDITYLYPSQMHIVAGNPVRSKEKMSVQYDERWKKRLTAEQIDRLSLISGSLRPFYLSELKN